jgi:hypothetical protein
MAVLIDDRRFGARSTERRSGSEYQLEILVGLLIAQDSFGALEQSAELDERGDTSTWRRLKDLIAHPPKTKRAKASLV